MLQTGVQKVAIQTKCVRGAGGLSRYRRELGAVRKRIIHVQGFSRFLPLRAHHWCSDIIMFGILR